MNKQIDVRSAIDLLKSGETIDNVVISDMTTSKVMAMDALLLAKNGFIVPDGNIVYDDDQVQYDPDFDDVTWGKPIPFKQLKESLTSEIAIQHAGEGTEAHEEAIPLKLKTNDKQQHLMSIASRNHNIEIETREIIKKAKEEEQINIILKLQSKGKSAAEISDLMDLPLQEVEAVMDAQKG